MSQEDALELFVQGLRQLDTKITDQQVDQFLRYRQELLDWNARFNLTAITDPDEILFKHFLDSLSLLAVYDKPQARVLDIGAGAGFPDSTQDTSATMEDRAFGGDRQESDVLTTCDRDASPSGHQICAWTR